MHIDDTVRPAVIPHRRIPFHICRKVETKLNYLEEHDIIEKLNGPTPWVSPIVTPPKPNNPEEIRICTDMRLAKKPFREKETFARHWMT